MFINKTSLLKKIIFFNFLVNPLIFNLDCANSGVSFFKLDENVDTGKINNLPINNKYESEAPNIAEDKNNIDLDIDYLESKKTLDEYIIDTGDALFIEFENKFGRLQEKSFISRNPTDINYLKPNTNLDNYLLDEGDTISIKFKKTPSLSTVVSVNKEGEVFLPRIKKAYIRGLTINQLKKILESRYQEYLINPEIEIRIVGFKFIDSGIYKVDLEGEIYLPLIKGTFVRGLTPVELSNLLEKKYKDFDIDAKTSIRVSTFKKLRILLAGEIRSPGIYEFPAYTVGEFNNIIKEIDENENEISFFEGENKNEDNVIMPLDEIFNKNNNNDQFENRNITNKSNFQIKRPNNKVTTISNAILRAGGVTSRTDLARIELIRDVPISKGGGKKRTLIDFSSFINDSDPSSDIRLYDGDRLFFPKLDDSIDKQIPKSILSGISPKFIQVDVFGRVENTGKLAVPLEATLSDVIDLTGPVKPLSGKIVLIRYNRDGTIIKKNVSYSARAKRGSKRNPYLRNGDLISVKNSFFGKTTGVIQEITAPFIGIYSTKSLIDDLD